MEETNLMLLTLIIILLLACAGNTILIFKQRMQITETQQGYAVVYRESQEIKANFTGVYNNLLEIRHAISENAACVDDGHLEAIAYEKKIKELDTRLSQLEKSWGSL